VGGFKSGFNVLGGVSLVSLLGVSKSGVIRCLVESLIVGLVDGLKVCLFRVSTGGVIRWCFNVYGGVL
jgi:ABC-type arginine transport system permease subunit